MKQRLVGVMVLGSLALIFIPLLLDGEGVQTPPLDLRIPPAPVVDQTPLPQPQRPEILADSAEPLPVVQPPFTESEEPFQLSDAPGQAAPDAAAINPDTADAAPAPQADTAASTADTAKPTDEAAPATAPPAAEPAREVATAPAAAPPAAAPAPATAPARSETAPALDTQGLPEAWTVRLGVFAESANAEALVARLLAAGHKAYLQPVRTAQGSTSGVFVGPVLTRQEATTLQRQLTPGYGEGMVLRYGISP